MQESPREILLTKDQALRQTRSSLTDHCCQVKPKIPRNLHQVLSIKNSFIAHKTYFAWDHERERLTGIRFIQYEPLIPDRDIGMWSASFGMFFIFKVVFL